MPSISGTKTRAVSLDLGLEILGNFLQGFGVPSAGLSAAFQGAKKVSFSFNQVIRYFVDVNDLGERVARFGVDRANPAGSIFFQEGNAYRCCILDSAITSRDFTISVEETSKDDFHIDVPTLEQIVTKAKAGMSITESSKLTISFQGDKQLGFAFSCLVATNNTLKPR